MADSNTEVKEVKEKVEVKETFKDETPKKVSETKSKSKGFSAEDARNNLPKEDVEIDDLESIGNHIKMNSKDGLRVYRSHAMHVEVAQVLASDLEEKGYVVTLCNDGFSPPEFRFLNIVW
jgi:cysteine synthase